MKIKLPIAKIKNLLMKPHARVISFTVVFAISGIIALVLTKAASSPGIDLEAENGSNLGALIVNSDTTASGGKHVQFGTIQTPKPIVTLATALTVEATDGVVSNAICIDSYATIGSSHITACIQINPGDTNQARGGTYDITYKQFTPAGTWSNLPDTTSAGKVTSKTCTNSNHSFAALGPLGNVYYGAEVSGSSATFGTLDSIGNCVTGGGGALTTSQWATPAIYCSASAVKVSSVAQLQAINNGGTGAEYCIAPGNYALTSTIRPKTGVRIIGDPIQRATLDASNVVGTFSTGAITIGGSGVSNNVTVANIIASNAKTPGQATCSTCGMGLDVSSQGDDVKVYNVKMTGNQQNGFHYFHPGGSVGYLVENSEISNNGNVGDVGATSAGLKAIHAGIIKNNVVTNNLGNGLWCDGDTSSVCGGGTWNVADNYVKNNSGPGIHFEIAFNGALIQNNVVEGNNTDNKQYSGGISVYGIGATVTGNIFPHKNGNINHVHGILIYTDWHRSSPPLTDNKFPVSSNDSATGNYMNGEDVFCTAPYNGTGITCSPNF